MRSTSSAILSFRTRTTKTPPPGSCRVSSFSNSWPLNLGGIRSGDPTPLFFRHAPLFITDTELYHVTGEFLATVWELGLYDRFSTLKGADLLYACIALVENILLVTHDSDFDRYSDQISLIKPRELYGTEPR
jgi:hypothetical protein